MQELGWKRGTNLELDLRWGETNNERIQMMAKELVAEQPDVIQVTTRPGTAAVLHETRTIPVVFSIVSDPVGSGFVASLSHPGGNATGFINIESSMGGKWVELLKEVAPDVAVRSCNRAAGGVLPRTDRGRRAIADDRLEVGPGRGRRRHTD